MEEQKKDALVKAGELLLAADQIKKIEDFQKYQNSNPRPAEVKKNKYANDSKFLPIGVIERTLDEIYSGLWQTRNFKYQIVVNEMVGDIELMVFHPFIGQWITRSGAAAIPITVKKGTEFTEVSNKIINAMLTVHPHLKAECLKNAAKSLGVIFGRNLNRDEDFSTYQTMTEKQLPAEFVGDIDMKLSAMTMTDEVNALFKQQKPEHQRNLVFKQMFMARNKELTAPR